MESDGHSLYDPKTHGLLKAVQQKIQALSVVDVNDIVHKDRVTGEAIIPVEQTVARLINIIKILSRCGLEILTAKELASILETILRINSAFDTIRSFDSQSTSPRESPESIKRATQLMETVAAAAYQNLSTIIAKTFFLGEYFDSQVNGASEHFNRIAVLSQEAKATLSDIQKLARAEIGNRLGEPFAAEASRHSKAAIAWTIAAVVCALIAALSLTQIHFPLTTAKLIAIETSRVVTAGFLFYLMVFCATTASSHRHNEVISLQRRYALEATNIVTEAAYSDSLKESLLAQAVQAVYATAPSGFRGG